LRALHASRTIAGIRFDALDCAQVIDEVVDAVRRRKRIRLSFANAEFAIEGTTNRALMTYLDDCDLVLADGSSIVSVSRMRREAPPLPARVTGTDFVHALATASARDGLRLAFVGGQPGVAADAARRLASAYPGVCVVATLNGYDDIADSQTAIDRLNSARADVVMVCLGNPRQEAWIAAHDEALDAPVLFGNGGALDFAAGRVRRAPAWMQRAGAEWAFRLVQDPSRTRLRRQLRLPLFFWLAWRDRILTGAATQHLERLLRAVSWNAGGTVLARGLTLASSIVVGRALGAEGLGGIAVVQQTVTLLVTLTALGLPTTLTTDVAAARVNAPARVGSLIATALTIAGAVSLVIACILASGGSLLAGRILGVPSLNASLVPAAVLLVAQALFGMQLGALAGLERFKGVAVSTVLAGAAAFAGAATGAHLGGVQGAITGLAAGAVATAAVTQLLLIRAAAHLAMPLSLRGALASARELWATARASTVTNLLVVGSTWMISVMLARQPNGAAAVGMLTIGMQWRAAVLAVPLTASTPLLSILSSLRHDRTARRSLGLLACAVAGGLALAGALAIGLAAARLVHAYGHGFASAAPIIMLLVASAVPLAVAAMLGQLALGRGDRRSGVVACVAWSVALLLGGALLMPAHGAIGAALATLVAAPVQVAILWKRAVERAA
jgi:N-acetylglucosaminyldiphosphoundecaprenol N-acetyl-beta-D-mannosaminyltransferase